MATVRSRVKDKTAIDLNQTTTKHYTVWISFAEIYNENIYDLFEKLPEVKNKGEKPRRIPLKLADDRGGWVYIKGKIGIFYKNVHKQLVAWPFG